MGNALEVAELVLGNFVIRMEPIVKGMGLGQLFFVEEHEVAIQFLCDGEVVRDDDDGRLKHGSHVVNQRQQVSTVVVVKPCGRFVHQEKLRVHGPRTCNGNTLLHAHAQLVREHVRKVAYAHQVHGHIDFLGDFGVVPDFVVAEGERDVVCNSQVRNQCCVLEHITDLTLRDFKRGEAFCRNVFAKVIDVPFERSCKACNHAENGALSLAGRAADANGLAEFQGDVCHCDELVVLIALASHYILKIFYGTMYREKRSRQLVCREMHVFKSQGFV